MGTVASQRARLEMMLPENSGTARAERDDEKMEAAAVTEMEMRLFALLLRRAARAAPLRTASMDWDGVETCVLVTASGDLDERLVEEKERERN